MEEEEEEEEERKQLGGKEEHTLGAVVADYQFLHPLPGPRGRARAHRMLNGRREGRWRLPNASNM